MGLIYRGEIVMENFLSIGTAPDNDIVITGQSVVSKYHAIVFCDRKTDYCIYDLASKNNTYITGDQGRLRRITYAKISLSDEIHLSKLVQLDMRKVVRCFAQAAESGRKGRTNFLRVGKDPKSEIVVNDSTVSRRHAIVGYAGEAWFIVDADSKNGTYVNGKSVNKSPILPSDKIALGDNHSLSWNEIDQRRSVRLEENPGGKKQYPTWFIDWMVANISKKPESIAPETTNGQTLKIGKAWLAVGIAMCLALVGLFGVNWGGPAIPASDQDGIIGIYESNKNAIVMIAPPIGESSGQTGGPIKDEYGVTVFSDEQGYGSGFLYERGERLLVITNKHVVLPVNNPRPENAHREFRILVPGGRKELMAQLLAIHPDHDIALLQILNRPDAWPKVELGLQWGNIHNGDSIVCISYLMGPDGQRDVHLAPDLIKGEVVNKFNEALKFNLTNAPGASGGPIFDMDGKVIALNRGANTGEDGQPYKGASWGVPSKYVYELLEKY
jgi:pSer/pThr/pTyr-binding forkhead associated (FHA) protein